MYLLDANILMTAADSHYPHDVVPGFWTQILDSLATGESKIPESVHKELIAYRAKWVSTWTKTNAAPEFILNEDSAQIQELALITNWVINIRQPPFKISDRNRFLSGADPRIIAVAAVTKSTIVTYEKPAVDPTSRKVKIPDVAAQFGVSCVTPIEMLRGCNRVI
ncbi:PIN domain-containing protein [Corynebacterium suranareeae]|uniref:PIN domain-containing protein n=1 Tax=Corynebacterium suranareeae TaxID=2506452 RepID=A0A169S6N8_9CORY|nr:DUF4411 family protein [Corynebacterium suranareeae]BAU97215.1 PIN domain-containing protein [Corynebacterium suranareeae]